MLFEDMNWMAVEDYLQRDNRIVVITGSCEQHAYLSLLSDTRAPLAIAREACRRENVLIAPPIPFGISPIFTAYPGTLSLRPETFAAVVREVIQGLLGQGFRRVLVSNGHGGNTGLLNPVLAELGNTYPDARLALFQWWVHPALQAVAEQSGRRPFHANWSENFDFNRVGPVPDNDKPPVTISAAMAARDVRAALGDGVFGDRYQAPTHVMEHYFEAAVKAMVTALRAL